MNIITSSSAATPPWINLPAEITAAILIKLGPFDMLWTAQWVCTAWHKICKDPAMWRDIDTRKDLWLRLWCQAVDRSQGQLLELNIECFGFGSSYLLEYISQRSGQLRLLRLVENRITAEVLSRAVVKFPLLEELHLYKTKLDSEAIRTIGSFCPLLKLFKLNSQGYKLSHIYDEEALAVATSMPRIHHLELFGSHMTNKGVTAILDGCPKLESLDLRQCLNVDLGGDLGEKCSQQIKYLRRPNDSIEDYAYICGFYEILWSDDDDDDDDDDYCIYDAEDDYYLYGGD